MADVLDRLLERQFLLSPWVREKRLRNQLRLVLKVNNFFELLDMQAFKNPFQNAESFLIVLSSLNQDHLEAGPVRRSTVTKVVHDAHQVSASLAKIVSISALPFYLRCFPYGGPRSEKRWVTSGLSPFKPNY